MAAAVGSHQPLARARLTAGLLHQWQQRNLAASLSLALRQLEDAGNLDNVRLAIQADRAARHRTSGAEGDSTTGADGYGAAGGHRPVGVGPVDPLPGTGYRGPVFMDSDIYKTRRPSAGSWRATAGPMIPNSPSSPTRSPPCSRRRSAPTATSTPTSR